MNLNFFYIFFVNNSISYNTNKLLNEIIVNFLLKINFIKNYFFLNEILWQEGLLIDFIQKKIIDNWIKKFLIYSAYLFNEKLIFDEIVKFYLNLFIWPFHKLSIFEFDNVSNLLFSTLFFFFFFFLLILFLIILIL